VRFDESNYQIEHITVLPYMGAIRRENIGYTFVPDGSGALVRSEDIGAESFTMTNVLYGPDFSFYNIRSGHATKRWRMPVYGAVEEHSISRTFTDEFPEDVVIPAVIGFDAEGNPFELEPERVEERIMELERIEVEERSDGFIAIIEEGDAMAQISTTHGGPQHKYNSTFAMFTPRPTDQYMLNTDATGLSSTITIASRRRYTGNYMIRYIMLSDNRNPDYRGEDRDRAYEATWVGMASAYRDYLERRGELTRLTGPAEGGDIPLFIETLGQMWVQEYVLGFPVMQRAALTSFDNIQSMIDELNAENINNLNFKVKGWNNGGLSFSVPTRIQIHKVVGGAAGLRDLMEYAGNKGATVYPDVELALVWNCGMFNGFNFRRDLARSMNDQLSLEQNYFFLFQDFTGRFSHNIMSPGRIDRMYDLSMRYYNNYNPHAISIASMSRELHSDQNRRNLVNRQEAKGYMSELLERVQTDHGRVLGESANAYAWQHLSATINVDLDGSRMFNQSEAVPFYGMVTHGYLDTAGEAINMSGEMRYDILKALENGSNPYFIVAYQNASRLKEAMLFAPYYSVNFQTWFDDIVRIYHLLNDNLKDVRYKLMVDHEFLGENIAKVTYEGNISFILNYRNEEITVEGHTIEPLGFVRIN
ncbi:MAG: DUF5696 domain-containing protein, partial [Oscillospiraceae bacterium]|nr:DUF5696 domain-containing protein [Oscillospiraceae bacterium]